MLKLFTYANANFKVFEPKKHTTHIYNAILMHSSKKNKEIYCHASKNHKYIEDILPLYQKISALSYQCPRISPLCLSVQ